jgi:hypothetical protein
MTKNNKAISFDLNAVEGTGDYTLIPAGRYAGKIEQTKFVTLRSGEQRLWVGVRISGPKQANRFITTLCVLDASAKSAYKTKALIESTEAHLGAMYLPADPAELIGAFVAIDVVVWKPENGNTVNDIRSFAPALQKAPTQAEVAELIEDVASHFDIAQAEVLAAKAKRSTDF